MELCCFAAQIRRVKRFNQRFPNIKIENISDSVIDNWYLCYNFDNVITNIWNAEIYNQEQGKYVIKNAGWNQDISVGGSVEFGFSGSENFAGFPSEYELLGESTETSKEDYTVEYHLDSNWESGFTGTISITNNTDIVLEDWILEFDFDRTIISIWNAAIESQKDNHYIIKNVGYNSNIEAGQTISFGFTGKNGSKEDVPLDYRLYNYSDNLLVSLLIHTNNYKFNEYGRWYIIDEEVNTLSGTLTG